MESLGDTMFLFRFGTEADKRKIIAGGPGHHEQTLVLLIETINIGDVVGKICSLKAYVFI